MTLKLRRSIGINIELPFEQEVNPFVSQAYGHRTFFSRLHHFMIASDAFVVVPGGIGSLLELSLAWQLLQVRKLYNTPLILVGKMWADLVEWARSAPIGASPASSCPTDPDALVPLPGLWRGASAPELTRTDYRQNLAK